VGDGTRAAELSAVLAGDVLPAAHALLGCHVTTNGVTVCLTEVEAYAGVGQDPASHAHRGRTPRNAVMFGPAGYAYVYFTYGMHWCLNVVCGPVGTASAVLVRAGSVVDGLDRARSRRPGARSERDLARGPARLTQALGIDGSFSGTFLLGGGPILLSPPSSPVPSAAIQAGPRVGVNGGKDEPWRFWLAGEPSVSAYRRHVPRTRRG
jgi:DNA-3-methyladenine glycosylase